MIGRHVRISGEGMQMMDSWHRGIGNMAPTSRIFMKPCMWYPETSTSLEDCELVCHGIGGRLRPP